MVDYAASDSRPPSSPRSTGNKGKAPWFSQESTNTSASAAPPPSYHAGADVSTLDPTHMSSHAESSPYASNPHNPTNDTDIYATRFGWRLDYAGASCYVIGPVLAVMMLILETRNDWLRFHGFQSLLLSAVVLVLHLILLWSSFLSWLLFILEWGFFWWLSYTTYRDAEMLRRWKAPMIGDIAERWVAEE